MCGGHHNPKGFQLPTIAPTTTNHATLAKQATATTSLETHTKFASGAGQDTFSSWNLWRENVAYQRAGYAIAGVQGRVKTCGTVPIVSGRVALGTVGKGVAIKGLHRCGNRWCLECQSKIASHKATDVEHAMQWAIAQGLIPVMYTLTGAHVTTAELDKADGNLHEAVQGVTVETVRKRMSKAWAVTRNGRRGSALKDKRIGMITAQEVTLDDFMFPGSRTGIHWHRHVLVLVKPVCGQSAHQAAHDYGMELFALWKSGCKKVDLKADISAFDIKVATTLQEAVDLGKYVSKGESTPKETYVDTLHKEMTRADAKNAGKGRVSPEQLLRNIAYLKEHNNPKRMNQLVAQWKDLERGTKGVHWLQWSPGLRDLVGLGEDMTDEEIVHVEMQVDSPSVAVVTWDELKAHVDELRAVVRSAEDGTEWETLLLCLDSYGISYVLQPEHEWAQQVKQRLYSYGTKQR